MVSILDTDAFSSTGNMNNAQEHQDTEIISLSGNFVNEWKPAAPAQWVRFSLLLAQAVDFQCFAPCGPVFLFQACFSVSHFPLAPGPEDNVGGWSRG